MFDEELLESVVSKEKLKKSIKSDIREIEKKSWKPFIEVLERFVGFYDGNFISAKIGKFSIHGTISWVSVYYVIRFRGLFGKRILKADVNGLTESFSVHCDPKYIPLLKDLYVEMSKMVEVKLESEVQSLDATRANTELIHFGL